MVERQPAARVLDGVFAALSDRTRRNMLRHLAGGERTITELAAPFEMSFAAVSKHVRVLERAGLVHRTIRGRTHYCRLEPARLADAQAWLNFYTGFWNERLDALASMFRSRRKE
jgi:DNA-binding transcriptional ArsR family regulator